VISNHESPWDAEYFTQEKKALYIVYSLGTSVITICRPAFSNVAEIVGQIEYHDIRTSKICILGQEWHVDAFFRKKGFGFLTGRFIHDYVFFVQISDELLVIESSPDPME